MSGGKQTTKQDNSIDPWSQRQWSSQQSRVQSLLGGSPPPPPPPPSFFGGGRTDGNIVGMGGGRYGYNPTPQLEPIKMDPDGGGYQGDYGATGLSSYETRAGGLIDDSIGSYADGLNQSRDMINNTTFTPGTITPQTFADFNADTYVNPFADDMIARTTGDIEEAAARARNVTKSNNLAQSAYGGSRHGVSDALTNESMLDAIADNAASTRFNVWNAGADRFYQDVGNDIFAQQYNNDQVNQGAAFDLERAGLLADLVGQERGFQDQDINRLMQLGATERGVQDLAAARRYDNYWRRIQAEMGLLGAVPIIQDGESTTRSNPGLLGTVGVLTGGISDLFNPVDGVFGGGGK